MDIQELKTILNSELPDEIKKSEIINCLSKDEQVIPVIMSILEREREFKKELQSEMNLLLSKAHTIIDVPNLNKDGFVQKEIIKFYTKHKNYIGHCFKKLF